MRFVRINTLFAALIGYALGVPSLFAGETDASATAVSTNTPEKVGYAVGMSVGMNITNDLKRFNFDANKEQIIQGFRDALYGNELRFSPQQAQDILRSYSQERQRQITEKNKNEGEAFLAENRKKEGVKTKEVKLPDGTTAELQYKVIAEGTGEIPKSNDVVTVKYRGKLLNGTEFDSSDKNGGQWTTPINGVIKGWSEALQMMKVGAKWELYIPAGLAYGERQVGIIEPNSTLIFDVELLGIGAPKPATATSQPLTSDIVRVPSEEERKEGKQVEIIKAQDAERMAQEQAAKQKQSTNR